MTLRLAVITDIHHGPDMGSKKGTHALPLVKQFLQDAQNFKADFIISLGDEISGMNPQIDSKYKRELKHVFNKAACPVLKVEGNHCVRFQATQSPSRSFDTHGFHIVMWNPYLNRYTRDGIIPDPQDIEWLKNDLAMADKPTIILSHIPLRGPKSMNLRNHRKFFYPSHFADQEELQDIVESSGKVFLCLTGHRHMDYLKTVNGVHHLIQQSLVEQNEQQQPYSAYNLMEIRENAIHITAKGNPRYVPAYLTWTQPKSLRP